MSEEKLLKEYGCESLSEFIDSYLDCENAFCLLRSQFNEIERLNNIIDELEKEVNIAIKELQPNELVNGINLLKNVKFTIQELKENNKSE